MLSSLKRRTPGMAYGQTELIRVIERCGLTTNLKLCLDAGDAVSYSSGQSWLDRSGGGYDFFLGGTAIADTDDPTFNGTAGRRSSGEYWSFDGGDSFTYDTTNEAWMENLHKDNAIFTLVALVWPGGSASLAGLCGTAGTGGAHVGIRWELTAASPALLRLQIRNSGSVLDVTSTAGATISAPSMVAVSVTEATGANGGLFYVNGASDTFTSTYTGPSAGSASRTMRIGSIGDGNEPLLATSRIWGIAMWEGTALALTQLHALFMGVRERLGI